MLSPSLSRITKRMRSSITELSFHGIPSPPPSRRKSVTHVSGTFCYLCLGTHRFAPASCRLDTTILEGILKSRGLPVATRMLLRSHETSGVRDHARRATSGRRPTWSALFEPCDDHGNYRRCCQQPLCH